MQLSFQRKVSLAMAAAIVAPAISLAADRTDVPITSFTPGDIVVLRGGDATNSNAMTTGNAFQGEVNAYLDEYSAAGGYVGTINVGSGLTLPGYGSVSHEGGLNRSTDGQFLTFGGYTTAAGTTSRASDGSQTESIGMIGSTAGSLDTSRTIMPAQGTGQFIHAVSSIDGNQFYIAGKFPAGATPGSGLQYLSGGVVTTLQGNTDWRNVLVGGAQNTLYGGTGSSSVGVHGAYIIGSIGSPPTAATPSNTLQTNYSGGNSASNLSLINMPTADASAMTQNGFDVMYTIGDQSLAGITKYYFDGTTWQRTSTQVALNATNISNPTGLATSIDPANPAWVDIFVSGQNGIYSYVDKSADPLSAIPSNSFSMIAAPEPDEAFYGLAFAPTSTPEPGSIALAMGAAGLLLARRRRWAR